MAGERFLLEKINFSNSDELQLKSALRYCFEIFSQANKFSNEEKCVRDFWNNKH